jgi:5'-nucleotidase
VANWICDLVKHQFATILDRPVDIVLINCGSFRGDKVLSGPFTIEKLLGLLPFNDLTLAYTVSGAKLIEALEAGCSRYPAEHGGFPGVSSGVRVVIRDKTAVVFEINGVAVAPDKEYVLVTKSFLADGKDGYDCLAGHCRPLMDPEFALLLSSLVRRALIMANVLARFGTLAKPRKPLSNRFIDKLRKKDDRLVTIQARVEGRIVIE